MVDATNPAFPEQIAQVQKVLQEIGAADIPQIMVFNKLDRMSEESRPRQLQNLYDLDGRLVQRVFVSAQKNEGVAELREALANWSVLQAGPANQPLKDAALTEFEEAGTDAVRPSSTT